MEKRVQGRTPGREKPREVVLSIDQGELSMWLHKPDTDDGWAIRVNPKEFVDALGELGILPAADRPR
jgi:hypothetical protein